MKNDVKYSLRLLTGDIFGAITAAIIALPLSIAFGVASGVGAQAGLYAAIAIAVSAAIFGGTRAMVSGPTAPMIVAMAAIVTHSADSLAEAFTIVMLAGVLQIGFGIFRFGRFIAYTPYSVISGFMSGIGVIIIALQVLPVLGVSLENQEGVGIISQIPEILGSINMHAVSVAAVTLLSIMLWPLKLHRFIPATLGALIVGTLIGYFIFKQAPVVGTIPKGFPELQVPVLGLEFLVKVIQPALVLAIIGVIETLLVALISDAMTRSQHKPNREIIAQGISNILSGLVGGLPGSGSPVPTIVNIKAGGRTRVSAILCGLILFAFLFDLGRLVEQIPLAVLAALLIRIGWNVIDWRFISRIHKIQRTHVTVMVLTAFLTVFVDLITAVAIGLIASGMINAMNAESIELDSVLSVPLIDPDSDDVYSSRTGLVRMTGRFTFASASRLQHVIAADIRDHEVVIFDFSQTDDLDDSAVIVIGALISSSYEQGKPCVILGLDKKIGRLLHSLQALEQVDDSNYVDTLDEAKKLAKSLLPPSS